MTNTNFREYILSTNKIIKAGKSAEQNDLLVSTSKRNETLLHTIAPGSPFVNLGDEPTTQEIKEASAFCALKSQDWRDNKKTVLVHVFIKNNCYKDKKAKDGSWSVKKIQKTVKVKKADILKLEETING